MKATYRAGEWPQLLINKKCIDDISKVRVMNSEAWRKKEKIKKSSPQYIIKTSKRKQRYI